MRLRHSSVAALCATQGLSFAATCLKVALPATLLTLAVLLVAILDLVVRASAAIAQLTLGALGDCMAGLATVEASLLARRTLRITLLLTPAANGLNVTFLATLCAILILLLAVFTSMVGAATALAKLRGGTVCHCMACFTTVEALPLANGTLLPLFHGLVTGAALF